MQTRKGEDLLIEKLLYPKDSFCYICKDESKSLKYSLCLECRSRIEVIDKEFNFKNTDIDKCYSSLFYNNFIRDFIHKFKFEDKSYLYKPFSEYMIETIKKYGFKDFDIVVSVPIHWRKEAIRGYNQAYLLAKPIAMELNKPLVKDSLVKSTWTKEQNTLSAYERKKNLIGSFKVKKREKVYGKKILLIDDIFTTGSTIKICGEVLIQAGAKKVTALTFSSTKLE